MLVRLGLVVGEIRIRGKSFLSPRLPTDRWLGREFPYLRSERRLITRIISWYSPSQNMSSVMRSGDKDRLGMIRGGLTHAVCKDLEWDNTPLWPDSLSLVLFPRVLRENWSCQSGTLIVTSNMIEDVIGTVASRLRNHKCVLHSGGMAATLSANITKARSVTGSEKWVSGKPTNGFTIFWRVGLLRGTPNSSPRSAS